MCLPTRRARTLASPRSGPQITPLGSSGWRSPGRSAPARAPTAGPARSRVEGMYQLCSSCSSSWVHKHDHGLAFAPRPAPSHRWARPPPAMLSPCTLILIDVPSGCCPTRHRRPPGKVEVHLAALASAHQSPSGPGEPSSPDPGDPSSTPRRAVLLGPERRARGRPPQPRPLPGRLGRPAEVARWGCSGCQTRARTEPVSTSSPGAV